MNDIKQIIFEYDRKYYRRGVQLLKKDAAIEKYLVRANNKSLVIQNNRPLLAAKRLKHWSPEWKLLEGHLSNTSILEKIQREIENNF